MQCSLSQKKWTSDALKSEERFTRRVQNMNHICYKTELINIKRWRNKKRGIHPEMGCTGIAKKRQRVPANGMK